jgi:hypothetical protein
MCQIYIEKGKNEFYTGDKMGSPFKLTHVLKSFDFFFLAFLMSNTKRMTSYVLCPPKIDVIFKIIIGSKLNNDLSQI